MRQLKEGCCSLLNSSDRIWSKHHNDQVDATAMRRRQLHRHDSHNISCRDMVDLRLLDEASTALLARSPACLEPELFGVLTKMLFVCGSEASPEVRASSIVGLAGREGGKKRTPHGGRPWPAKCTGINLSRFTLRHSGSRWRRPVTVVASWPCS